MAEIEDLNTTDSSNTGRFPENQAPSTLNNGARGLEGMLARGFGDTIHSALVSSGTNTIVVTTKRTISALEAGHSVRFFAGGTNTGDATFNGVAVKHVDGSELRPGAITAGGVYTVAHDGTSFILDASPTSSVPDVSSTDLDNLIGTGAYTGATLTNAPTALGTARAYIEVIQDATDDTHITQRLTTMVADPVKIHARQKIADTWGSWVQAASLASPAFTGSPTAPTQDAGDNSTKISTTAYVERAVGAAPLAKPYKSTDQAITATGSLTLPHGLGVEPALIAAFLVCQTGDIGFVAGDVVPVGLNFNSGGDINGGQSIVIDDTNLKIRFGSSGNAYRLLHNTTGVRIAIAIGSWKFRIRAWA